MKAREVFAQAAAVADHMDHDGRPEAAQSVRDVIAIAERFCAGSIDVDHVLAAARAPR